MAASLVPVFPEAVAASLVPVFPEAVVACPVLVFPVLSAAYILRPPVLLPASVESVLPEVQTIPSLYIPCEVTGSAAGLFRLPIQACVLSVDSDSLPAASGSHRQNASVHSSPEDSGSDFPVLAVSPEVLPVFL